MGEVNSKVIDIFDNARDIFPKGQQLVLLGYDKDGSFAALCSDTEDGSGTVYHVERQDASQGYFVAIIEDYLSFRDAVVSFSRNYNMNLQGGCC